MSGQVQSPPPAARGRRWFQFSLKALAISVVVCGVLSWLVVALWPSLSKVRSVSIGPKLTIMIERAPDTPPKGVSPASGPFPIVWWQGIVIPFFPTVAVPLGVAILIVLCALIVVRWARARQARH